MENTGSQGSANGFGQRRRSGAKVRPLAERSVFNTPHLSLLFPSVISVFLFGPCLSPFWPENAHVWPDAFWHKSRGASSTQSCSQKVHQKQLVL